MMLSKLEYGVIRHEDYFAQLYDGIPFEVCSQTVKAGILIGVVEFVGACHFIVLSYGCCTYL